MSASGNHSTPVHPHVAALAARHRSLHEQADMLIVSPAVCPLVVMHAKKRKLRAKDLLAAAVAKLGVVAPAAHAAEK